MAADETSYLVCLRVSEAPIVVPGSTKHRCADCNAWVWASPASLAVARQKTMAVLCMACAGKRAETDNDMEVQQPTAQQLQEMRDTILKDLTERG
jgi:hypothetical protein